MAEHTAIAWTSSSFNPWIGCTKVGRGCDNCYAEALDKRHKWGGAVHWGVGVPRYRTSAATWSEPLKWEKKQRMLIDSWKRGVGMAGGDEAGLLKSGFLKPEPWRVFCASLADVFDNEVPREWRFDLWRLIEATPNLSWLLCTKRVGNVIGMIPVNWEQRFPDNVRLLITVCNQEEADRDIPKLLALPCKNGISYEPALGAVDWSAWLFPPRDISDGHWVEEGTPICQGHGRPYPCCKGLEWVIVGGESTQGAGKARLFNLAWARSTVAQCKAAGVPCFVKQLGSNPYGTNPHGHHGHLPLFVHRAGADPDEWPEDLRVQCFPE